MMYSLKDLSELAGYTSRVYTLISTLHRVHAGAYHPPRNTYPEVYSLADTQGTLHKGFSGVRFENVPVVAPGLWPQGGEELLENLNFVIQSNQHILIIGPNGAGKSAVARIIAGLWPVYRGLVSWWMSLFFRPLLTVPGLSSSQYWTRWNRVLASETIPVAWHFA